MDQASAAFLENEFGRFLRRLLFSIVRSTACVANMYIFHAARYQSSKGERAKAACRIVSKTLPPRTPCWQPLDFSVLDKVSRVIPFPLCDAACQID